MYRFIQFPLVFIATLCVPVMSIAQGISIGDRDPNGQSIKIGETDLVPSIRLDFQSTDNTFRTDEAGLDSTRVIVNPELTWFAERRLLSLKGKYEGNFASGSEDVSDFTDHLLGFSADAELNSKNRSRATISIAFEHSDVGTGVLSNATESDPNEVAEFNRIELFGAHTYGASGARGNLTGGLRILSVDYQNQSTFTEGRSFTSLQPFVQFGYRVSGDTRVIVGGQISSFSFDDDTSDRVDTTLFTGAEIAATGKLSGVFRIGATQSNFDNDARSDETSLFLDVNLEYQPSNFAQFSLDLRREVDNTRGSFAALESAFETTITANWDHQWSSRISTLAAISVDQFDGICPDPSDVVTTPSFEIEYAIRRWISFGLNGSLESRAVSSCAGMADLQNPLQDYERADFGAFIRGTL